MDYYIIRGPIGDSSSHGFVVKDQLQDVPVIKPPHHEIWDATLFRNHQDAENALGELPHKIAKRCEIMGVGVHQLARPA